MLESLDDLPEIRTGRLRIRPLAPQDAGAVQAISDNPQVLEAIVFLPRPFRVEDAERLIRARGDGRDRFLGLWSADEGELCGVFRVHLQGRDRVEIGYWIWPERQGRGYAAEAASAVVAELARLCPGRRVVARAFEHNQASRRVLRRAGLRPAAEAGLGPDPLLFAGPSPASGPQSTMGQAESPDH